MEDKVRRNVLKGMGAMGAGIAAPTFFMRNAWARISATTRATPSPSRSASTCRRAAPMPTKATTN